MSGAAGPVLTLAVVQTLRTAAKSGEPGVVCSLDLDRTQSRVAAGAATWRWNDADYPYPEPCKDRTVYYWDGAEFRTAARFTNALYKLVPTSWGPPTFEIDGIKMLPTAKTSPWTDAERKVKLIEPRGKVILDTCGGLGYFAAWCLGTHAAQVLSFEKSADVLWLRTLNPWSPAEDARLRVTHGDVAHEIATLAEASVDAVLHDPPRFGTAGELYSQQFYDGLARVLRRKGKLFHYTGTPNKLTTGRDVPAEVARRLQRAGFSTAFNGDGVLAIRRG